MTGSDNTASGRDALTYNTSGSNNTASGSLALISNTTGSNNTAIGAGALVVNTSGSGNTASGSQALYFNTGSRNTASGHGALNNNNSGNSNTAIGAGALFYNTSGSGNIAIGDNAGVNLDTSNNNIDIGNQGVAAEAGTIRIGTSGTHTKTFMAGINGTTTGGAPTAVLVDSNGQLGTVSSSRRYKFDINSMGALTDGLMRLRAVTFRYLAHGDNAPLQYGLIAEEVAEVYPEMVTRNKDGEVETVMYQFLAPMLLNQMQKQNRTIEEQQARLDKSRQENAALRTRLERLEKAVAELKAEK